MTWGIAAVAMALVIAGGVGLSVAFVHVFSSGELDFYRIATAFYDRVVSLDQPPDRPESHSTPATPNSKVKTVKILPDGSIVGPEKSDESAENTKTGQKAPGADWYSSHYEDMPIVVD